MSLDNLFGFLGLLYLTVSYCDATSRCLECQDMFKPFFCDTVTECADNEECYVERFVTSGGHVLFNSGCRSKERCNVIRKRSAGNIDVTNAVIPADSSSDILVCQECCNDTNFCNIKGCNEAPPSRSDRGPYCFACSNQNEHGCRHVTTCDMNYACEITSKVEGGYTIYDSSCVHITPTSECNTTYGSQYSQSTIIGKREATDGCPKCCDWDFCNEACTDEPSAGGFTDWQSWSPCQNTCGGGDNQFRMRTCTHPPCTGSLYEHRSCGYQTPCPVDGGFSEWNVWSGCTTTCGAQGTQSRHRSCTNPAPAFGGNSCQGNYDDVISCGNNTCPSASTVYTVWTQWTTCTVTCGPTGSQQRYKICFADNHIPNASLCEMPTSESRDCNNFVCPPVDGAWGMWSSWQMCSATCGLGIHARSRECNFPPPQNGGKYCAGDNTDRTVCSATDACPITDEYTEWGNWGSCSVSCGNQGNQMRSRACKTAHCSGTNVSLSESRPCQHVPHCVINGGWSAWHHWGHCTVTCGSGTKVRTRTCNHPAPKNGGIDCPGISTQKTTCNNNCQVHCQTQPGYILYPFYHTVDQRNTLVVMCLNIYNTPSTWYEARLQCQRDGADLLTFSSDVTYLNHLFPRLDNPIDKVWIGLEFTDGHWSWIDNTRRIGTFATSQLGHYYSSSINQVANGFANDRACVTDNGQSWVPVDCYEKHNFVCEKHV